jgi:hypothetical protein
MKGTRVFASKEEIEELRRLASMGWRPGVFSVLEGINRDQATVDARKVCHQLALKHRLPEIPGYYGIKEDGEFVASEGKKWL